MVLLYHSGVVCGKKPTPLSVNAAGDCSPTSGLKSHIANMRDIAWLSSPDNL